MDRTPDTPSNPISRAFSRFLQRGKVGRDADASRNDTGALPRAPATPARGVSTQRGAGTPGFAGTTASGTARPAAGASAGATAGAQRAAPSVVPAANTTAATGAKTAAPVATPARRTHTVEKGDTLSGIAQKVYGRADRWQLIYQANRDQLDDPDRIYPGQVLVIPAAPAVH